jgi:hypothetical protein
MNPIHIPKPYFRKIHLNVVLPSTLNIIKVIKSRRMRMAGQVERMGAIQSSVKILAGDPEEKSSLGRPRLGWKHKIKTDLKYMECEFVD